MSVDPERPQCIIEIESDKFRQWQTISERGWGVGGVFYRGCCVCSSCANHFVYLSDSNGKLNGRLSAKERVGLKNHDEKNVSRSKCKTFCGMQRV